jgi:hypothetical protein
VGVNDVVDGIRFDCILSIDLVVNLCFVVYVKSLDCVHEAAFIGRI